MSDHATMSDHAQAAEHAAEALPDHWSWFSLISDEASKPFSMIGHWLTDAVFGGKSALAHSEHINTEPFWSLLFVVGLVTLGGVLARGKMKNLKEAVIPDGHFSIRNVLELIVGYIYETMIGLMGKKAARFFLPLIGTCALLILTSNILGLIPGFIPPTASLNVTFAMALVIFFATHIFGLKENGGHYIAHFFGPAFALGPLPKFPWLGPLIFPIELISHAVRPITLGVRLTANMNADHMVLAVFVGLAATLMHFVVPIALPFYFMGCIVVVVQTIVFCLLSIVYIAMAIAHEEH